MHCVQIFCFHRVHACHDIYFTDNSYIFVTKRKVAMAILTNVLM